MPRAAAPKYSTEKCGKLQKWTLSKLFVLLKLHPLTLNIGRNINIFIHTNHYAMPQTTASNSHDTDEDEDIEILNDAPHKTLSVSIRISTIFKPECICLTTTPAPHQYSKAIGCQSVRCVFVCTLTPPTRLG